MNKKISLRSQPPSRGRRPGDGAQSVYTYLCNKKRAPLAWVAMGLLGALVATNVAFLILLRTGGPLIGLLFYLALLVAVWRRRRPDYQPVMVGGLVGFAVHVVEVILVGWTTYPLLMALNLALPAALALVAWLAGREV